MKRILLLFFIFFLVLAGNEALAQYEPEIDTTPDNVLLERQWSLGALIHTNGWGLKFRKGKNITALRQFMWELEFSTYKSPKQYRIINPYYSDSKSYFYGKLNYLFFLRGGVGQQHILNRKPYWGGVQLSLLYYGGISLGMTKPVYLYIINPNTGEISEEKYNPDIHNIDYIYGRASFLTGLIQLGFYPGIYVKTGLEFEFGIKNKATSALEVGATLDFSPIPVPIMAYNPKQQFFLTLYLSAMFGKRHNK
jgi:hypothetical protein